MSHYEQELDAYNSIFRRFYRFIFRNDEEFPPRKPDRKEVFNFFLEQRKQIDKFRYEFIKKVSQEDIAKQKFTSVEELQGRWREEFRASSLWQDLQKLGVNVIPYGWQPSFGKP